MEPQLSFIIIDDNVIDILIYKMILRNHLNKPQVIDFKEAEKGLDHIKENYSEKTDHQTILLLDLNMPQINGWEFLEQFEKLSVEIKNQIKIFILSFYVNPESEKLAAINPNVELIISKPLTSEKISTIVNLHRVKGM